MSKWLVYSPIVKSRRESHELNAEFIKEAIEIILETIINLITGSLPGMLKFA